MSAAAHLSAVQRVVAVVRRGEVATFLGMAVLFGIGMGTIDSFMFIYLRELGEACATSAEARLCIVLLIFYF